MDENEGRGGKRERRLTEHHSTTTEDFSVVESKDGTKEASHLVDSNDGTLHRSGVDWKK